MLEEAQIPAESEPCLWFQMYETQFFISSNTVFSQSTMS